MSKKTNVKPTSVTLSGKSATSTFFEKSGIRRGTNQAQRPFLAFSRKNNKVNVEIVEDIRTLVRMPRKTRVMTQWEGKNRSDFYRFTVGDLQEYIEEHPATRNQVV